MLLYLEPEPVCPLFHGYFTIQKVVFPNQNKGCIIASAPTTFPGAIWNL